MLNNVPQSSQTLGQTQSLIQANFSTIDTAFTVNHVQYNDGSGNQGKHAFVQFSALGSSPTPISGDISMYNYASTLTGINELFVVKSNATTTIPITASPLTNTGWSYLPSGVLLKWGTTSPIHTSNPFAYTFPVASSDPVFNGVFIVLLTAVDTSTPFSGSLAVETGTIATTGFSVVYSGTPTTTTAAQYLAIGY